MARLVQCSLFILGLLILVKLLPGDAISMSPSEYRRLVETRCFNQTALRVPFLLGQNRPVGLSLDYLISLIERIEESRPHLSSKEVLTLILKRFHYDGTKHVGWQNVQSLTEMLHRIVNERMFAKEINKMQSALFPEDVLTDDEKCAMFFMVSHTVNETKIDDNENTLPSKRELGAVSLSNGDRTAISMNSVFLGIAIGLFNVRSFDADANESIGGDSLEPLIVITFADKLAIASIISVKNIQQAAMFGATGSWNSTYCQTEYSLSTEGHVVTLADLNGAIDGWLMGKKLLSEGGETLKKLKLSSLLKRFYSKEGLAPDCGICSMEFVTTDLLESIRENARKYLKQWNELYNKDNLDFEQLSGYVEWNSIQFSQYIQKARSVQQDECTRLNSIQYGNSQCETSSDVFLMIDNNVQIYSKFQLEFVTSFLSKLKDVGYLNTATLLVNALRGFESDQLSWAPEDLRIPLHLLAYNSTSVQLATCRLAWYPYRETTINNKKTLLDNLVQLFERNNVTNSNSGNAKNFVWLSLKSNTYRPLNDREKMIYHKYRFYLKYFLNIRTFFISTFDKDEDDDMNNIVINPEDWFQVNPINLYDQTISNRIVKKICETPTALTYENCLNATSSSVGQVNLITPGRKQYWAIYPKHFLQSRTLLLQFKANKAKIRVCLDRYLHPENNAKRNCKEASTENGLIQFQVETPCRWKTVDTCLPIYFTVSLANQNFLAPNDCFDPRCKSLDQVQWTVTHSGLFCPKALFYSARPGVNGGTSGVVLHWMAPFIAILVVILSKSIK